MIFAKSNRLPCHRYARWKTVRHSCAAHSVAYTIRVRSAEYAGDPAMIQELVRRALTAEEPSE